jgi:hypothetical protein
VGTLPASGSNGASMEWKGIQYSIVQTTSPRGWRWIVYLPGRQPKSGTSSNRQIALRRAQIAIDQAIKGMPPKPMREK